MSRTWVKSIGLILFFGLAAGAAIALLERVGKQVLPQDRYVIQADVTDAIALATAADVRQAGVKIGRVTEIREHGRLIQLELSLDPKYAPIYKNATTLVRAKSIAEENYVELDPGTPDAGRISEGGRLPVDRNLEATQNDDVFSIFDKLRRTSVQRALGGLAPGVDGRGGRNLNRTLESMTALVDDASPFAEILAAERVHTARLIDSLGTVAAALGQRREAIQTLTRSSRIAAEAVAVRDEELRDTLATLPPLLAQARDTAGTLSAFSRDATPVVSDLRGAMEALLPVAQELRPAAVQGRRALAGLQRFSAAGTPTFRALPRFADSLSGFVPAYEGFIRNLNPLAAYLDPYHRDLASWFQVAGAATAIKDNIGHVARVLLPISRESLPGTLPPEIEELVSTLMGSFDVRGSNAFPAPQTAADPAQGTGEYPRLTIDPPYSK